MCYACKCMFFLECDKALRIFLSGMIVRFYNEKSDKNKKYSYSLLQNLYLYVYLFENE